MTIVTKASLAAELEITRARVSQYVKEGLPVRSDGKLNREDAINWIADRYPSYGRARSAGVNRASQIRRSTKPVRPASVSGVRPPPPADFRPEGFEIGHPVEVALFDAIADMVVHAGTAARDAARRLGMPVKSAWLMEQLVTLALRDAAESTLDAQGVYRSVVAFEEHVEPRLLKQEREWPSLAERAGEAFDEDAWLAELNALVEARADA